MKIWALALAVVVGLVPVFAHVCFAQDVLDPLFVLPDGDELLDDDLLLLEGILMLMDKEGGGAGGGGGLSPLLLYALAEKIKYVGQKIAEGAKYVRSKLYEFGMCAAHKLSGFATWIGMKATQHPLATRTISSGISSAGFTAANGGDLKDILVSGASGVFGGAIGHGVSQLPISQQNSLLTSVATGAATSAGFEALYRALDPSKTLTLRDVSVAGAGGAVGSLVGDLFINSWRSRR